ncbi:hypothetical protein FWF89_03670 [Candidatus Saccharibacteria bacterium]|nr:hypothetical protein [Candidatus Saccharibacteria bacterium]
MVVYLAGWDRSKKAAERLGLITVLCARNGHEVVMGDVMLMRGCDAVLVNVGLWRSKVNDIYYDVGNALGAGKLVLLHDNLEGFYCSGADCEAAWPMCDDPNLGSSHVLKDQRLLSAMYKSWKDQYGDRSPFPIATGRPFKCPGSCLRAMSWVERHVKALPRKNSESSNE